MIKQFYLENFKSFAEPTTANLDELLVIAGSNSGGKSTIIQALLLLAQTLENPRPEVVLDLGGRYVQFAEFGEMVHGRPSPLKATFTIGFDIDIEETDPLSKESLEDNYIWAIRYGTSRKLRTAKATQIISPVHIRITFAADRSGTPVIQKAFYKKSIKGLGNISFTITRERGSKYRMNIVLGDASAEKRISSEVILDRLKKLYENEPPSNIRISESSKFRFNRDVLGLFYNFGFSINEVPSLGTELKKIREHVDAILDDPENFLSILQDVSHFVFQEGLESNSVRKMPFTHFLLPDLSRLMSSSNDDPQTYRYSRYFSAIFGQAMEEIRDFLLRIKYIGPLRAKPERAYLAIGSPIDIGNAGENAIPILWLYQNDKIVNKISIGGEIYERKLVLAVQDWLQEFGIAYSFHITKPKRVIYQAELESAPGSETMVTIADVGFGVSQLLPVIVAGLRAPKSATLILEQPEIHLHPRLQGKLADFLICMVELGKKVIVETHSEHLINMLRLRIVQDKSGSLQKKIGIIFVRGRQQISNAQSMFIDQDKLGSYIENLKVDEYGKIINWPPDFFPETGSLNEEILKAMMDKFPKGK